MGSEGGGQSLRPSLDPSQAGTDASVSWFLSQLLLLGVVALWLHSGTLSFVGKGMGGLQLTSLLLMVHLQRLISLMNMNMSSSLKENPSVSDQPKHGPSSADQGSGAVGQQDKIWWDHAGKPLPGTTAQWLLGVLGAQQVPKPFCHKGLSSTISTTVWPEAQQVSGAQGWSFFSPQESQTSHLALCQGMEGTLNLWTRGLISDGL